MLIKEDYYYDQQIIIIQWIKIPRNLLCKS